MIRPIRNNVLVECLETNGVTAGGLFIPDAFKGESNRVKVVAVGSGTKEKPMKLKVGSVGYRVQGWGQPIEDNGKKYYLMEAQAIIATE